MNTFGKAPCFNRFEEVVAENGNPAIKKRAFKILTMMQRRGARAFQGINDNDVLIEYLLMLRREMLCEVEKLEGAPKVLSFFARMCSHCSQTIHGETEK